MNRLTAWWKRHHVRGATFQDHIVAVTTLTGIIAVGRNPAWADIRKHVPELNAYIAANRRSLFDEAREIMKFVIDKTNDKCSIQHFIDEAVSRYGQKEEGKPVDQ